MKSLTDLAGNLDVSTAQVLTALRIVATRAEVEDLARWAAKELEGYEERDELPRHRIWKLTIVATLHNPMQGAIRDAHLGDFAINENQREAATTFFCRDGVGNLEAMLTAHETRGGGGTFGAEHRNLTALINSGPVVGKGWSCTHAMAQFSPANISKVVNTARQTALTLCLECEKNGIDLQWGVSENTNSPERTTWINILKEEGTRAIIRDTWSAIRGALVNL